MNLSTWFLFLLPAVLPGASGSSGDPGQASDVSYVCPPCGAECHFTLYPKAGNCGGCGMGLVPLSSVPQVGVLFHPSADLVSSTLVLSVFASSNVVRVFGVADTAEPLRFADALEVRPQFAFGDAPALDVLVLPEGFGAWDDPMTLEWVKGAVEKARFVLATGGGSILLAKAGYLKGEHVPGRDFLVKNGKQFAEELVFEPEPRLKRSGKFLLARDPLGALDAALAIVQELSTKEKAQRTAQQLGYDWKPEGK